MRLQTGKKMKQLCVKQRVRNTLVEFAARKVGLGFYDKLARLPMYEEKNDF
jgi:hypothetical protein